MTKLEAIGMILLYLLIIIATPFALIWSLNTLFHLGIPTTWDTWLAAMIIATIVRGTTSSSSSD